MVKAEVQVNPRLRSLSEAMRLDHRDMEQIKLLVDDRFVKQEKRLFATEGSSGGPTWPALEPNYAKWKKKRFPGRKIMSRKGRLRKSLTHKGHPDHVARYSMGVVRTVSVGTQYEVAAYHIKGKHNKVNPRKERNTLQFTGEQARKMIGTVQQFIVDEKLDRELRAKLAWRRSGFNRGGR